jgi:hypothetical protein
MAYTIDRVDQGGLTRPIRTDDGQDLSLINVHTDPIEGFQAPKGDVNILDLNQDMISIHIHTH